MAYSGVQVHTMFVFPSQLGANQYSGSTSTDDEAADYRLPNLSTLSISTHREKLPVRALGKSGPRGYTYGPRTTAGSMVFINPSTEGILEALQKNLANNSVYNKATKLDELPPFNVVGMVIQETGAQPLVFELYGVTFVDNGTTLGVDEGYTETVVQYLALDLSEIKSVAAPRPLSNR
jgi:hypothetical protein